MKHIAILIVALTLNATHDVTDWQAVSTWLSRVYPTPRTDLEQTLERADNEEFN